MCKTLESVVRLYHDARFYIHFMENITKTTQIFSYKGSEKTLLKDSKAKSYLKFKRLNNKKGQIFVNSDFVEKYAIRKCKKLKKRSKQQGKGDLRLSLSFCL